jgi:hypothetical protein
MIVYPTYVYIKAVPLGGSGVLPIILPISLLRMSASAADYGGSKPTNEYPRNW